MRRPPLAVFAIGHDNTAASVDLVLLGLIAKKRDLLGKIISCREKDETVSQELKNNLAYINVRISEQQLIDKINTIVERIKTSHCPVILNSSDQREVEELVNVFPYNRDSLMRVQDEINKLNSSESTMAYLNISNQAVALDMIDQVKALVQERINKLPSEAKSSTPDEVGHGGGGGGSAEEDISLSADEVGEINEDPSEAALVETLEKEGASLLAEIAQLKIQLLAVLESSRADTRQSEWLDKRINELEDHPLAKWMKKRDADRIAAAAIIGGEGVWIEMKPLRSSVSHSSDVVAQEHASGIGYSSDNSSDSATHR